MTAGRSATTVTAERVSAWKGYFAAAPTPFGLTGDLDTARLRDVLAWFLDQRAHGIVVNGTTGEWVAQTVDERRSVAEVARDVVTDVPLLVGIGSIRPADSIELGRHAAAIGADGALLTIPPARWLDEGEIVDFYTSAAQSVPLPLMIYNVPIVTGYDIPTGLMRRLLAIDGIVGVKDNAPSATRRIATLRELGADHAIFSDVLEATAFPVYADEHRGRGQIGSGMPLGRRLSGAIESVWAGQADDARPVVEDLSAFKAAVLDLLGPGRPWHAQSKALMLAAGVDAGYPRFPSSSIRHDDTAMARLAAITKRYTA